MQSIRSGTAPMCVSFPNTLVWRTAPKRSSSASETPKMTRRERAFASNPIMRLRDTSSLLSLFRGVRCPSASPVQGEVAFSQENDGRVEIIFCFVKTNPSVSLSTDSSPCTGEPYKISPLLCFFIFLLFIALLRRFRNP